jgi:hypothetical protein
MLRRGIWLMRQAEEWRFSPVYAEVADSGFETRLKRKESCVPKSFVGIGQRKVLRTGTLKNHSTVCECHTVGRFNDPTILSIDRPMNLGRLRTRICVAVSRRRIGACTVRGHFEQSLQ